MIASKITNNLAQEIVNAIKEIVNKDINFIDRNGIIIGSTNSNRINTFHEAGKKAMETFQSIYVKHNKEYTGCFEGINFPIRIDKELVGVVGVTGKTLEIEKYEFLITKIAEVFIKEHILNYKYETYKQKINYVVKSLIYDNIEDRTEMENIIKYFNIDIQDKFAIVIIKLDKSSNLEQKKSEVIKIFESIGNIFNIYVYPNEFIAVINHERYDKLKKVINTNLRGGVGRLSSLYDMHKSYKEARIALKYSLKNEVDICYIENLNLEIIFENLETNIKNQYKEKVLKNLSEQDISMLNKYYENAMSLNETAKELFIHKNTLQYKLRKVKEKNGLDPRDFYDSVTIYLALCIRYYK